MESGTHVPTQSEIAMFSACYGPCTLSACELSVRIGSDFLFQSAGKPWPLTTRHYFDAFQYSKMDHEIPFGIVRYPAGNEINFKDELL